MEEWRHQVVEMEAESSELPLPENARCTPDCAAVWDKFDDAAFEYLENWVFDNPKTLEEEYGAQDLWNEEGPYLIYMTLAHHGVGIWDGSWDHFFVEPDKDIPKLTEFLQGWLSEEYQNLEMAILEAAEETAGSRKPDEELLSESYVIKDSGFLSDKYDLFYMGKTLARGKTRRVIYNIIRQHMRSESFYPDVYYINDHGNIDLLDKKGDVIYSWV